MDSNNEYCQRRCFEDVKWHKTTFFEKEYIVEIPVTFDSNGMFINDDSNVSNNWVIGIDEVKKDLEDKCADIVKIVKPKHEPRTIKIKI